ncbi:chemotaxis protein CheY [Fervidicella metallireducens AeB]|uniref:Protein-glutamate methylesterase/protein-glutamine glutaminase n=1 Tax=Fervidicella metallireducens AeB TaxID=1403537 RepID=A0A017RVF9_9CLOT|nr:chemotaxis response regulator protein-glutamate methylesterase [Fervidicella metallireducens]EYE88768.1 chemotaxis protein CheY [Fervidicella metallireducens AeB]
MFEKIRVLVVDDSALMRKIISDMINSELDMEVIDTARDGEIGIKKAALLKPDVVTLDVEMPNKNGLEALQEIKKHCNCQVIMLSSLTSEGSEITIESLRKGAFDFIQKPSGSISLDISKVKEELIEKIRYAKAHNQKNKLIRKSNIESSRQIKTVNKKIDAVVLGASTGGPKVLFDVITNLPNNLNVPIFVVQHMPAGFTKAFAERLDKNSKLTVKEGQDGQAILPNTVYIAPGGYHMLLEKNKIRLDLSPTIHGVRPAVDKLFTSAAEFYKENLLGCVFTGMGKDGAEGVKKIKANGGYIIAQDELTSTVYGMPKAAYETGCVDVVLPDHKIAEEIIKVVKRT